NTKSFRLFKYGKNGNAMRRVVVTGLGAVTPLGVGVKRTWKRLLESHCGIVSVADYEPQKQWQELSSTVAGIVPKGSIDDGKWQSSDWLTQSEERRTSLFTQYAMTAASEALKDAEWSPSRREQLEMTGVCLGSGIGNLDEIYKTALAYEKGGYKKVSPIFVPKILINMAAGHIAMKYGFQGPNHTATTACTTGAHSIGDASRFIACGDADVMVAGGAEACIHPLTFAGFGRSRRVRGVRRRGRRRSRRAGARKARGARVYAELRGYGSSGDAHHMTAPREDGSGALLAMKKALKSAGLRPNQVDYVNAHATGTTIGDAAEAMAIQTLMAGPEGYTNDSEVTVSGTKGSLGHLLGAAGAIEALVSVLSVQNNVVPPTLNLHEPDVAPKFNLVPNHAQQKDVEVAITNSFGFGGTNASLVLAKYHG
ncbi:putative CEM1-beta-keto-acyl-ACP synthase- mitochondrial, partial [Apiospora hydei]